MLIYEEIENTMIRMPDKISLEEMELYGYMGYKNKLPLRKKKALELYDRGANIYILFPNNTEVKIGRKKQIIEAHEDKDLFGISTKDWVRFRYFEDSYTLGLLECLYGKYRSCLESNLLESLLCESDIKYLDKMYKEWTSGWDSINFSGGTYSKVAVFQKKNMDISRSDINIENYELVYSEKINITEMDIIEKDTQSFLEYLFVKFNGNVDLRKYHGSPISIGDILVISKDGATLTPYLIEQKGFKELDEKILNRSSHLKIISSTTIKKENEYLEQLYSTIGFTDVLLKRYEETILFLNRNQDLNNNITYQKTR